LPFIWAGHYSVAIGLYGALVTATRLQQGETVRVVHVPCLACLACHTVMALASAVAIIFRHPCGCCHKTAAL
jgi:hypothetical protein